MLLAAAAVVRVTAAKLFRLFSLFRTNGFVLDVAVPRPPRFSAFTARCFLKSATQKDPPKPLWTCPKCKHRFVTRNLWHSCVRVPLANHFAGKEPIVRRTFNAWRALARDCGPVTVYAQKSRIVFMVRVRFGGAIVHKTWVEATLWLKHRVSHPRLHRLMDYGKLGFGLHLRLTSPDDIDAALAKLMREAYRVGCQQPVGVHDP